MAGPLTLALLLSFAPPDDADTSASAGDAADAAADASGPEQATELPPLTGPAYVEELEVLPPERQDEKAALAIFQGGGSKAFTEGRFEEAIEFFAEAYRTYPSPGLLFSLGQAHKALYELRNDARHRRLAILRYGQYVRRLPDGPYAPEAERYMTALFAQSQLGGVEKVAVVTRVMVSTTAEGAWLRLDGGERMSAPAVQTVEPGSHTLEVGGEGYTPVKRKVNAVEGTMVQVSVEPKPLPARLTVTGPRGADVAVDGRTIGQLPLSEAASVEPGIHVVAVTKNGSTPYTRQIEVGRDEDIAIDAQMRNSTQRVLSYTLFGLGGAGVAAGAVTMGLAFGAQANGRELDQDFDQNGNGSESQFAEYNEQLDRRDSFRTAAIASGAVGGGLLITGIVLFVFDRPQVDVPLYDRATRRPGASRGPALTATPILGGSVAGAQATVRF